MTEAATTNLAPGAGDLFQLLRDGKARTRAELATITHLARSTITSRVDALISSGLVAPVGEAVSTGGRPPARFALNAAARIVIAIDLGASHATMAVTDMAGQMLVSRVVGTHISDGPEAVLDQLATLGVELVADAGRVVADVAGVGIGVPGPVEHGSGRPTNPPIMPGWNDYDVPGHLGRTFDCKILVDNDVNLMALGEHSAHWSNVEHLLFVKVATGIGAGIIAGGALDRGAQGTAGDLGHVQVPGLDRHVACRCGNVNCLEAVAAGPALARSLRDRGIIADGSPGVVRAVQEGNLAAVQAVRQAGRDLGSVLSACVNLLNPSVIVIGGELSMAGEFLIAGVREVVYQRSLPLATSLLRIVPSRTAQNAGVLGAGAMMLDSVLAPEAIDTWLATR